MKAIIQRVKHAKVEVENETIGEIGTGILVLLGIADGDNDKVIDWVINKITGLRIFPDDDGVMNISLKDYGGEILVVSNFTVYGETKKGFRPGWSKAAPPLQAEEIYNHTIKKFRETGIKIETGKFQAMMDVSLNNWGPVTLIVEKENNAK